MSSFGERFKSLRLEKNLKQEELIKDFNSKYHYSFTRSAVSQYENNKRIPEVDALKDFASYFGVSVDYLLANSDIRKKENLLDDIFAGPGKLNPDYNNDINTKKEIPSDSDKLTKELAERLIEELSKDGQQIKESDISDIIMAAKIVLQTKKHNQDT